MSLPKKLRHLSVVAATAVTAAIIATAPAQAGSVENLERERAMVLQAILMPDLGPSERMAKISTSQRRLVDLERIVLRDDSLTGRATPAVRTAFENYDLTFLMHAATEKKMLMVDNWFTAMGLTTQSLMATKTGPR
jgi:hypothetical protein